MSDQGNGSSTQKAAENAFLKWAFPSVFAGLIAFGGLIGMQVLDGQKEAAAKQDALISVIAEVKVDVAVMKTDIGYLKEKVRP